MRFKKSVIASIIAVTLSLMSSLFGLTSVKAEGEDLQTEAYVLTLVYAYQQLTPFMNLGGEVTTENVDGLIELASSAMLSAEYLKGVVTPQDYNDYYRDIHADVMQVLKNAYVYKIENGYDSNEYSATDGGLGLIHAKVTEFTLKVRLAETLSSIMDAYGEWVAFINSNQASKKRSALSSSENGITVNVTSATPVFAEDDVLVVAEFIDSVIIKNTRTALEGSGKLKTAESGIAYYLSLEWRRNGVVLEGDAVPEGEVSIAIDLKDLNLASATDVQVARYLGGGKVAFIENAKVENGYLVFTLSRFGSDIESEYSLDFAIVAKGYAKKKIPYGIFVAIGVGLILIVAIIVTIVRGVKKRRRKKEYKTFVKRRKFERKNKTFEE